MIKKVKKIINQAKVFLNYLNSTTKSFRHFCEDISNDNPYTNEDYVFRKIDNLLNAIKSFNDEISDNILIMERNIMDKERASVLFPYEKQAIWEYLRKWNDKHNVLKMFGCIYAEKVLINNKPYITIGISVCNDQDVFSKNIAVALAKKRAREYPNKYSIRINSESKDDRIPSKLFYEYAISRFMTRCNRWFKDESILYPSNVNFVIFPDKKKKDKHEPTDDKMPF